MAPARGASIVLSCQLFAHIFEYIYCTIIHEKALKLHNREQYELQHHPLIYVSHFPILYLVSYILYSGFSMLMRYE